MCFQGCVATGAVASDTLILAGIPHFKQADQAIELGGHGEVETGSERVR